MFDPLTVYILFFCVMAVAHMFIMFQVFLHPEHFLKKQWHHHISFLHPEHPSVKERLWSAADSGWGCASNIPGCWLRRRWWLSFILTLGRDMSCHVWQSCLTFDPFFLQATLACRSLLQVPSKTTGCSTCWSWTWTLLDGWWNRGGRVHISEKRKRERIILNIITA